MLRLLRSVNGASVIMLAGCGSHDRPTLEAVFRTAANDDHISLVAPGLGAATNYVRLHRARHRRRCGTRSARTPASPLLLAAFSTDVLTVLRWLWQCSGTWTSLSEVTVARWQQERPFAAQLGPMKLRGHACERLYSCSVTSCLWYAIASLGALEQ
jgi:hypothetical protein